MCGRAAGSRHLAQGENRGDQEPCDGKVTTEKYDKLVLSPGAAPIHPPLPGIDLPRIFSVKTVPDARVIREWIERGSSDLTEERIAEIPTRFKLKSECDRQLLITAAAKVVAQSKQEIQDFLAGRPMPESQSQ